MGQCLSKAVSALDTPDKINMLLGTAAVLGSVTVAERERRRLRPRQVENARPRWQDHPVVPWLIENGCIFLLCNLFPAGLPSTSFARTFVHQLLQGFAQTESVMLIQHFLVYHLYAHIPFFAKAEKRPQTEAHAKKSLKDWLQTNFVVHILGAAVISTFMMRLSKVELRLLKLPVKFRLDTFLLKFAFVRVVNDIVFYLVHRCLHSRLLYAWLHKRHHEHNNCALVTNFHFTVADLFLESFTPGISAIIALKALGVRVSPYETNLCFSYLFWYEIASHSGKPIPTSTFFPPLSLLYGSVSPSVDADTVKYHETHHNKVFCNYGITQWIDRLMGTHRL